MTTSDKTADKLVQSIRKTKAGTPAVAPKTRATTTRKKAPAAKRRSANTSTTKTTTTAGDPYQSGRRVWPD